MILKKEVISYPVSVTEVKAHVKSTDSEDDFELSRILKAATKDAENIVGMDIAYTLNTLTDYDFRSNRISINEGNFKELVSIEVDDVSIGHKRIRQYPHKFEIELHSAVNADELEVKWHGGYSSDDLDTQNLEAIKNYILVRCDSKFGPERSEYNIGVIKRNEQHAEHMLAQLKGYY
jgi:hypothetical protein